MHHTASRTAWATACLRAVHQAFDSPPLILTDPVALALLGADGDALLRSHPSQWESPATQRLRRHVVLRSRLAEDRLHAATVRGVTQCVIVGAGFDTFAWRQPHWAAPISITEVDHPATQALKRCQLNQSGWVTPSNVRFLPADLEREPLTEALDRAGLDRRQPTFFSWLGVSMYLQPATVTAALRTMASWHCGSEVVFDVLHPLEPSSNSADSLTSRVAGVGEPFLSRFSSHGLEETLTTAGFGSWEVLRPGPSIAPIEPEHGSTQNPERASILSAMV